MVELIVAMVLLVIVMVLAVGALTRGLSGAGSARAGAVSDAAIARANTAIASDVAAAQTTDRAAELVRDPFALADAVRNGSAASSDDVSTPKSNVDLEDVLVASPDELRIQADVASGAGVECVTWRAQVSGGTYRLVRMVDPPGGCGSGSIQQRTFLKAETAVVGSGTQPFSYRLVRGPGCTPTTQSSVPGRRERGWIVAVNATLVSTAGGQRDISKGAGTVTTNIRSREISSYRKALGC